MPGKLLFPMLAIVLLLASCSHRFEGETSLDQAINPFGIDRVEVLSMRSKTEVPTRVSGAMLEQNYACKLELRGARVGSAIPAEVLYQSYYRVDSSEPDVRMGAIFYNSRNERIATLFFDDSKKAATLNGKPAKVRGYVLDWLDGLMSCK